MTSTGHTGEMNAPNRFDSWAATARSWFGPLVDPAGWMGLAYLFVGMVLSLLAFVALNAVAWTAFGLAFVLVGVFLTVPAFRMVEALCEAEVGLAQWVDQVIEFRRPLPLTGSGPRGIRTAFSDPVRMRQVGFILANVVLSPLLYSLAILPYAFFVRTVLGFDLVLVSGLVDTDLGVLGLPFAVAALGAGPRVSNRVVELRLRLVRWFLGPDRLAVAEARAEDLEGQRQQILDAVAAERRRIERNLHDGVQQQLVALGIDLGMAESHLVDDPERARGLLGMARQKVQGSIGELRQLGRGLHPAILEDRGLDAALSAVVANAPLPISVHVDPDLDLGTDVAETAYFVANEAVANVLKHAQARVASVHVARVGANVRITVHDDGVGGIPATGPSWGSGLAGIKARVEGRDGVLTVTSPVGGPTTLTAELPRHG